MLLDALNAHEATRLAMRFVPSGECLTYGELCDRLARYGGGLAHQGLVRGDVVLIFLPMSPEAVLSFLGAMAAGGVPAFMPLPSPKQDPAHYWASHRKLFEHIADGILVAPATFEAQIADAAPDNPLRFAAIEDIRLDRSVDPEPTRLAFLQHSSGTTGLKKGVAVTHDQLTAQLHGYAPTVGLGEDSVVVSWLPLYHDMGLIACMLLPLFTGATIVYLDTFRWVARPRLLFSAIDAARGTHVWMPNFAFQHMTNLSTTMPAVDLSCMQRFINCSEPCRPAAFARFSSTFEGLGIAPQTLTCSYAMAEAVFAVTQSDGAPQDDGRILSSGRVIEGLDVRIVTADGAPAPAGDRGEIEIRGEFVFDGYFKDPERTAQAFRNGWYRTRDLGRFVDGELYVDGRTDDMIIINGRNLVAHEVEAELSDIVAVIPGRAVVFGCDDPDIGSTALVAICETEDAGEPLRQAIIARLSASFAIVPKEVILVAPHTIMKTTSGKVDRANNRARYLRGRLSTWN